MVSKESLFFVNFTYNNPVKKDYFKIAKKMLYKKYTFGQFSYKKIFTNYLIFNYKCRLTLFFKEFLISDNSSEYLRNFYHKEDLINILGKILEIYCLYSKIYPNYIILNENKFLYKNIRKKQKMIDENNKNNEINYNNNDISNKSYELFTLSVRNEIKEFIENNNTKCNNDDNVSNKQINKMSAKKINDNWVLMSNKKLNQNVNMDKKKINNNKHIKNNSVDSFWTNDTNNLSTLLNAINDKIVIDDKNKKKKENKNKKKEINYRNINQKFKLIRNQNKLKKENNSSSKKPFNKNIYKKLDNNNILTENSRNNNFLKSKNKANNKNIKKPLSSSLTNKNNNKPSLVNKGNSMSKHLLTDKNWNKDIKNKLHQYYSLQKDSLDKNIGKDFKKIFKPFIVKKKHYSKDFSKDNKYLSINAQNLKYKFDNFKRKKSPQEFLKIFFDGSNKNIFNENSIKEEKVKNGSFNNKFMYRTNNNFNSIRNRKLFLKKYLTNHNLKPKIFNQRYTNNLTESNSQALINYIKENHFTYNNTNNNIYNDNKNDINDNKKEINDNKKEINDIKKILMILKKILMIIKLRH